MNESEIELVRSAYEAFDRRDMDTVMRFLQDTEWHEAKGLPWGGMYTGAEAIMGGVFGAFMPQLPDFKATPQEILSAGEGRVLAVGDYTGHGSGGAALVRQAVGAD
jgi:ketosteroid isomerase-like protein